MDSALHGQVPATITIGMGITAPSNACGIGGAARQTGQRNDACTGATMQWKDCDSLPDG